MRVAAAQGHFETLHSPRIHAKNGNLRPRRTLSLQTPIAGNAPIGRSTSTDRSFNEYGRANRSKERAMTKLTKTLTALAAAATIAVAAVAAATGRGARRTHCRRHHRRRGRRRSDRRGRQWPLLRLRTRLRTLLRLRARLLPQTGVLRRIALLLEPPAILGRLALACAARAGLRLNGSPRPRTNESKSPESSDSGPFRKGA